MKSENNWTITDTGKRIWLEGFCLKPEDLGCAGDTAWSIRKSTLRGGYSDGVDLVEIDNGTLSLSILPTRGMGVWKGDFRGMPIGWKSPVPGPVHPKFVNLQERGGLGWVSGFDEMIVRCGLDSTGAPGIDVIPSNTGVPTEVELTLHGKIANLPASRVEVSVTKEELPRIAIIGEVVEAGLFCPQYRLRSTISTVVNSNTFTISDEVTNLKAIDAEMELLYHCNFGAPFLDRGARLEVPASAVFPRDARAVEGIDTYATYLGPTTGYVEQVYWYKLLGDDRGRTLALLKNTLGDRGLLLRFNLNQLPAFTQWKNTASEEDGYVTGLEPATSYPNSKRFERSRGRVVKMSAGETYCSELNFSVLDSGDQVAAAESEIAALQSRAQRIVHREPHPEFSEI